MDCSEEIFGEDFADLAGLCRRGEVTFALCEECGVIAVDYTGKAVPPDKINYLTNSILT